MISPNQFKSYPPKQYHCATCKGRRIVWHPEIRNCHCPACKGKGYLSEEDMTADDYLRVENAPPITDQGRKINHLHLQNSKVKEIVQKRRGRPPKR